MKTGLIIPCYNEADRIDVKRFVDFIKITNDYHLCFVNDGSSDHTIEVLKDMKRACPERVSVVNMLINKGKAAAVRNGAKYLYTYEDIEYIGFIDADLSTDFNDFNKLVNTLKFNDELEMVYGSRRKGNSGNIERNFFRDFFSRIIKMVIYMILRLPIEDTQCGAKVFKRKAIPVAYGYKFLTRWLFDVEIFIRLKNHFGLKSIMTKIYEQPLEKWNDVEGSKLGLKDAFMIPMKLVSIWYSYSFFTEAKFEEKISNRFSTFP